MGPVSTSTENTLLFNGLTCYMKHCSEVYSEEKYYVDLQRTYSYFCLQKFCLVEARSRFIASTALAAVKLELPAAFQHFLEEGRVVPSPTVPNDC